MLNSNLVLITDHRIAAFFSGCDVWLIPIKSSALTGKRSPEILFDPDDIKNIEDVKFLDFENKYLGDDWYISGEAIFGYEDEECIIAIEKEEINRRMLFILSENKNLLG